MKKWTLVFNRLLLLPALFFALVTPCRAMTQPTANPVASMEELLRRYHSEDAPDSQRVYFSEQPLVLTGKLTLDATQGAVELAATAGIRVSAGAELTLDNPGLLVMGPPPVITVERGGTLRILRWNSMMTDGTMPADGMIRIEEGGRLLLADGLTLPSVMVIEEHSSSNESSPPPEPEAKPEPEPQPEPELRPVDVILDSPHPICQAGRVYVEAALPSTVMARLLWTEDGDLAPDCPELAVCWDLSGLDCDAPGTYTIYGDFISEGLTAKGVSNPLDLRPVAELTILKSAPIHDLSWQKIGNGTPKLRLSYTPLPEGAEALYLLRSEDGMNWRRCVGAYGENFLPAVTTHENTSFLVYRWPVSDEVFYLRLEVVGSAAQGAGNVIRVPPLSSEDALGGGPKSDAEDGGSEGNQGGGGQGHSERTGQQKPESTPEPASPPTADPPQRAQAESGGAETEPQSDMAGASGPQQPAGGGHTTAPIFYSADSTTATPPAASPGSQLPPEQAFAERLTAPDGDTGGGLTGEDIPAVGADTEATVAEETDAAVAEELSTVRQEPETVAQKDGDRGGLAALVTLSLCGGVAATGAVTSRKKSGKRRS